MSHIISYFKQLMVFKESSESKLALNMQLSPSNFFQILICLVLLGFAIELFHIEEGLQLPQLMWVVVTGFAVYSYLPVQLRLPFFLILNIIALILLFGTVVGLSVLSVGVLLIILASLPIRNAYKILFILVVAMILVALKIGMAGGGTAYQVSTIIGGLFMFRLILYLYEVQHEKSAVSIWKRMSYFFLLPNLIFLLFPIVDYKTFVRGFYCRPALETCQKGIHWIFIGFIHLLIYRIIYLYAIPVSDEIEGIYGLIQYLVFSYALLIRLSGIFHLSVGILCLFGFDLPRSFNNYFLASSFSDYWHRINIYWKDFLMRILYFPIFLRFKNRNKRAVFLTVLLVFVANFFMHAYQWFWIRGNLSFSVNDFVFWGALGLLLAFNSVLLMHKKDSVKPEVFSAYRAMIHALKVLGMFIFMCMMWSIWISESLDEWWRLLMRGSNANIHEITIILLSCIAFLIVGVVAQYLKNLYLKKVFFDWSSFHIQWIMIAGITISLCAIATPQISQKIATHWSFDIASILHDRLNEQDVELLHKGYYEELIIANNINTRVWELQEYKKNTQIIANTSRENYKPSDQKKIQKDKAADAVITKRNYPKKDIKEKQNKLALALDFFAKERPVGKLILQHVDNLLLTILIPNSRIMWRGAEFSTNAYGMRDRSYTLEKPTNTYRIAQLGGSLQMGTGVADAQTAENLVEDRLNASGGWGQYPHVEILNFAMPAFMIMQRVAVAETLLEPFKPDMIWLHLHTNKEEKRNLQKVAMAMFLGFTDAYPKLLELQNKLGIDSNTSMPDIVEKIKPYQTYLFTWSFDRLTQYCAQHDIVLVVVLNGVISTHKIAKDKARMMHYINERGLPYIDTTAAFEGYNYEELQVRPDDYHLNAKAHQLIAKELMRGLRKLEPVLAGDRAIIKN